MKTLYLLPYDEQKIQYSFNKIELETLLKSSEYFPYYGILSVEIEEDLADQISITPPNLKNPFPHTIEQKYYNDREKFLENEPGWHRSDGFRLYIIFEKNRKCFWCSSGNNLNSIFKRFPDEYLGPAIRVELSQEAWIRLMGYSEWACDNF